MSSPDHPSSMVFGGILGKHLRSSSEDGLQLHPLVGLFEA